MSKNCGYRCEKSKKLNFLDVNILISILDSELSTIETRTAELIEPYKRKCEYVVMIEEVVGQTNLSVLK